MRVRRYVHDFCAIVTIFFILGVFSVAQALNGYNCQPGAFNCVVGGYSSDMWIVPRGSTPAPLSLFAQSPDSQVSQYLSSLFIAVVNIGLTTVVPNSFEMPIPLYVQIPKSSSGVYVPSGRSFSSIDSFTSHDLFRILMVTDPSSSVYQMSTLNIPLAASTQQVNVFANTDQNSNTNVPSTNSVDLNSLLLPLQYDSSAMGNAYNFIQFATGITQMPPALDMTKLPGKLTDLIQKYTDLQNYITTSRILTADQSVGLSNLYFLFAERIPQSNTPQIGSPPQNVPQINSPLKFENYIATRRYTDPNWIQGIQHLASPAELQRQNIYLLRDLLYVEYQRQMVDERVLAAMSMLQLNTLDSQKNALKQISQKLQSEPPFSQSSSTTNNYAPGK